MGGRDHLRSKILYFLIENTGNFVLMGAWQPRTVADKLTAIN